MSKARDIADSASIINYLDGLTTGLADSPTFTGTVTASALAVDTDVLLVDDTNNRVGINVASPAYELDIDGNIKVSQGLIFGDSTGYLYEGATDQINFRIGTDGPYVTFKDIGSSVAEFGNASGALALKTGASERMRIDASGNVGIGTSSPGYLLDISGANNSQLRLLGTDTNPTTIAMDYNSTGSTDRIRIQNDAGDMKFATSNGQIRQSITKAGNVGIGTSSPNGKTEIASSATGDVLALQLSNSAGAGSDSVSLRFRNSTLSTSASGGSEITGIRDASANGGSLLLKTSSSVGTMTERLRIDSSGNVGIGTQPSTYLTNGYVLRLNGGAQTYLAFNNSSKTTQVLGGFVIGHDASAARITQRENDPIIIATNNTERMRIDASGNVGIGTTAPSYKLDTYGAVASRGSGIGNAAFVLQEVGNNPWYITQFTGGSFGILYNGTSSANTKLSIDTSGNLLINTTSGNASSRLVVSDADVQVQLKATSNSGFINFDGTNLQLSTNRDLKTGSFSDSAKSNAALFLRGGAGGSIIGFYTAPSDNTTATERMRINNNGDVSIGTTTVGQFGGVDVGLTVDGGGAYSGIAVTDGATTGSLTQGYSTTYLYNQAGGNILFGQGSTERMRIGASGKVSIGTNDNSDVSLTVAGSMRVQSYNTNDAFINLAVGATAASPDQLYTIRIDNDVSDSFEIDDNTDGSEFFRYTPSVGIILNEESKSDNDFRVESDTNTHALFVDASTNRVVVGSSGSKTLFNVIDATAAKIAVQNTTNTGSMGLFFYDENDAEQTYFNYDMPSNRTYLAFNGNGLTLYGKQVSAPITEIGLSGNYRTLTHYGSAVFNENGDDYDFRVESDTNTHALFVDAGNSRVGIHTTSPLTTFDVRDTTLPIFYIRPNSVIGKSDTISIIQAAATTSGSFTGTGFAKIQFESESSGGGNRAGTGISFYTNLDGYAGTTDREVSRFNRQGTLIHQKAATFNEEGGNNDFRVESDTNTHALFVDASSAAAAVSINTSNVGTTLNGLATAKLYVNGAIRTGSTVMYGIASPNGRVFTFNTGTNGQAAFIKLTCTDHLGIRETIYRCWNASGNWNVAGADTVTNGTAPTFTVAGSGGTNPTITVSCNTSYSGGYLQIQMNAGSITMS